MLGCYIGARMSGAADVVQKYSGIGIFAQGGVAIGLSIMASEYLGDIRMTDSVSFGDVAFPSRPATVTSIIVFIPKIR